MSEGPQGAGLAIGTLEPCSFACKAYWLWFHYPLAPLPGVIRVCSATTDMIRWHPYLSQPGGMKSLNMIKGWVGRYSSRVC